MKLRRALGFAVLAYLITMIFGIILSTAAGIDMSAPNAVLPTRCRIVSSIAAIGFTYLMSNLYLRSSKVAKGRTYGLYFGLTAVVVGFILDVAILVPTSGRQVLLDYYSMPIFRVTLVLILVTSALAGHRAAK